MNANCYKVIFSKRTGTLVAVGEHTTAAGKAASGQANRSVTCQPDFSNAMANGLVGVLRLSFASVVVACLTLGNTQAQSSIPAIATLALPQGASVNAGSATISTTGAQMAITQSSDKASINWQSFSVGTGASVNIAQPSASAVLLNRVMGNDPSQILGKLSANGQVILLNPNGILFGKDGSVTASAFTASTFGLSDVDFMNGFYKYNRNGSTAAVVNEGTIETSAGGFVALIGASVTNDGKVIAPHGNVIMAAAESVILPDNVTATQAPSVSTVSIPLSKKVRLELSPATLNTAIENTQNGVIVTEGGQVLLQASTISTAVASITHSGSIDTSGTQGGAVQLLAEHGNIKVDGAIKANSSGNDGQGQTRKGGDILIGRDEVTGALSKTTDVSGARLESDKGFVETSGELLQANAVRVKAGEWLLDPTNIRIVSAGASGTAYATNFTATADSDILASDINDSLNLGTSVTIATSATGASAGYIAVIESISKTAGTDATLTLKAHGDINLGTNKTITSTSGKLNVILNSDFGGNSSGAINLSSGSGITSNGGNITLGGGTSGNGTGSAFGSSFHGISLVGATISSGAGNVTLTGTSATSGNSAFGVYLDTNATITTTTGAVNITATAQTTGQYGYGMIIRNGAKVTTGSGNITVNATGSNVAVSDAMGIQIRTSGAFATTSGNVSITGTSRGTSGNYNAGIDFASGGSIVAGSTGMVTITGTAGGVGGSSVGVNTANVTTTGAAVNITGTASSGGATAYDVTPGTISTTGGNVTITGNTYAGSGTETVNAGTGSVTIQNRTAGTLIDVGATSADVNSGTLKLGVSSAELARITAATVVVGRNDGTGSGNVNLSATNLGALGNTAGNLTVLSGNNIAINGAITKSTGTDATLTLNAVNGIDISNAAASVGGTVAGVGKFNVAMTANGNAADVANSSGLFLTKVINANGGTVSLTGTNKKSTGGSVNSGVRLSGASIYAASLSVTGNQTGANTISDTNGIHFSGTNILQTTTGTSTLTGNSKAIGNFGGGIFFADSSSTTFDSGSGSINLLGLNSTVGYRGIRIGGGGAASINAKGNITFEDTLTQVFLRGQLTQQTNTTVSFKGKGVSMYAGTSVVKAAGATGTILNLEAQTVVVGESGNAALTADTINLTGNTTGAGTTGVQINNASTLTSSGTTTITASGPGTSLDANSSATIAATGGLTVNINNAGTLASLVTGGSANAGGLTKQGAGTLTLGNSNTHQGATLVSAGTLQLNNVNALQNSTLDTSTSGTQLVTFGVANTNTYNLGGLQGSDALALGVNSISIGANNSSTTYSGILSGAGGVTKVGTGNLTLSGQSTNTGDYNANAGTLTLTGAANTYRSLTGQNVFINNGATVAIPNITQGGVISSNMVWTFGSSGGGNLNINANFVNRGTNGNKFVTTGGATNTINGNINLDFATNLAAPTFDIAEGAAGAVGLIHTGSASNGSTTQGLTKNGAGTLQLSGANNYKGPVNINAGTVELTGSGTLGASLSSMTIANAGVFKSSSTSAQRIAGVISGLGSIIQAGTGAMTLSADNTYSGGTNVNSGSTLNVGEAGATGSIGTGAVTLANNANLNFVRAASTNISNDISGTGNLNATITGASSDLTLSGTTNITGAVTATATGAITTTVSKHISTTAGASLAAQTGVTLNSNITNNTTGAISITAGNNTTSSTAAITAAAGATITQNAAASVTMTTDALGDLTVANIIKGTGAGDVTVASGIKLAAGVAGGDIKTVAGNSITNNGTGKTLIYTGSSADSGLMSNLHGTLATLYLTANTGNTQNAVSRTAYGSGGGFSGGPSTQVLFREAADVTASIGGATIIKNYGDATPTATELTTALTTANNGATTSAASAAGTLVASTSTVIADLVSHANLNATANSFGRIDANATGYAYTESGSSFAANGASPNVTLIVNKINASVTANSDSTKTYNGAAQTVSGFTATGLLSGETATALTGVTASVSGTNAGTYTNTASGTDNNYNLSFTSGSMDIGKANLSVTGANNTTTYNGSAQTNSGASISGTQGTDSFTISGYGSGTNASTTTYADNLSAAAAGATSLNNYNISYTNGGLTIGKANLTATANSGFYTYDGTSKSVNGFTASGLVGTDTVASLNNITASGATGTNANSYTNTLTSGGETNYNVTTVNGSLTIGKADLVLSGTRAYDAGNTFAGTYLTATGMHSETFSVAGTGDATNLASKNVQTAQTLSSLTGLSLGTSSNGGLSSNYNELTTSGSSVSVTPATLTVTGANNTATYNSFAQTNSGASVSGAKGSDSFNVSGYGSGTNASTTAYGDNLSLTTVGSTSLSNYNVTYVNGGLTIGKANLTIKANDDARFVTLNDTVGFNGASYIGLVGAETSNTLGGALTITRQNANTNVAAGTYNETLTPSGHTSTNYNISYTNGDYTIVQANTLLIRTTNQTLNYGNVPTFNTTAQYLDGGSNVIYTLTQSGSANNYTFSDSAGGSATMTLKPYTSAGVLATNSTSGNIAVGSYEVKTSNTTVVGSNFNGSPVFVGALNVTPRAVTANASNVSKVYDGTTLMSNVIVDLTGNLANDTLSISGTGAFSQKNVGQGLSYTIANITLGGSDADNYYLNGANSLTGINGAITPASLVLSTSNVTKVYDGTTAAAGSLQLLQGTQLFGSDTLSGGTFAFTDPSVGVGSKVVSVAGAIVDDGNGGANYEVSYMNNTQSSITGNKSSVTLPPLPVILSNMGFAANANFSTSALTSTAVLSNPTVKYKGLESCKSTVASECICKLQSVESSDSSAVCAPSSKTDLTVRKNPETQPIGDSLEIANLSRYADQPH